MKDCCPATDTHVYIYIYIYIYIHIYASFIKDDGAVSIIIIVIFQVFLLFFLCRDPDGGGIPPYLLPSAFDGTFGHHQG